MKSGWIIKILKKEACSSFRLEETQGFLHGGYAEFSKDKYKQEGIKRTKKKG
jgi:hypothetical protein